LPSVYRQHELQRTYKLTWSTSNKKLDFCFILFHSDSLHMMIIWFSRYQVTQGSLNPLMRQSLEKPALRKTNSENIESDAKLTRNISYGVNRIIQAEIVRTTFSHLSAFFLFIIRRHAITLVDSPSSIYEGERSVSSNM
jgi:hypothetical protein